MGDVELYSYWRSSCSWRVRISLAIKDIPYQYHAVNLLKGEQTQEEYAKRNPIKSVPTLVHDGVVFTQSVSILEYLEERFPDTVRLLPQDPVSRAKVRELVNIIAADTQPVQNLRVLKKVGDEKKNDWAKEVITYGFQAFEKIASASAGKYCVGDEVSLADVALVPQVYNANRFGVDMAAFPTISAINDRLKSLPAFEQSKPENQPDAVSQ
eukprot:TRINITY_DN11217_c0_g1_i1.p1 TRINITY_DN11217_c0_g1~~TRINITY_DN11217_c0_g1_i1.p1  ORF type:complete len:211 (-),score=37.88 TRINITY_DN11217_c0_g1_i1:266-898(-)